MVGGVSRRALRWATFTAGIILLYASETMAQDKPARDKLAAKEAVPVTGPNVAGMESYDRLVVELLETWKLAGASVAVAKDGRLVLARGYGWANVEDKKPVQPDALFRIASLSKPVTAVAVLRLVEQGRLGLDDRALDMLRDLAPPAGAKVDPRLATITIRQLLHHTGGWDRDKSFDAMFIPTKAAEAMGAPAPADHRTVIRYMLGVPLDFDPGTRYAYSNLGYAILGRVIEARAGKHYDDAVRELVLAPAGATRMQLGRTLPCFRADGEVHYYHFNPKELADPVFLYEHGKVPWPDGGFHLEAMDAHGGWIASAIDLVRFATAVDGRRGKALLQSDSVKLMLERPAVAGPSLAGKEQAASYYGLGWNVAPVGSDANWWHTGSLPGTMTLLVRAHNGLTWAVLFNGRPEKQRAAQSAIDAGMWKAAQQVQKWPEGDLFTGFR